MYYKIDKALSNYLKELLNVFQYNDGKQHSICFIIATQYEYNRNLILQQNL